MSLLYCMNVYIMHICVFIKEYCSGLQQVEPRLIAYSVTVTFLSSPCSCCCVWYPERMSSLTTAPFLLGYSVTVSFFLPCLRIVCSCVYLSGYLCLASVCLLLCWRFLHTKSCRKHKPHIWWKEGACCISWQQRLKLEDFWPTLVNIRILEALLWLCHIYLSQT